MVLYSYAFDSENELGEYLDVLELYLIEGDITVDEQPNTAKHLYKDEKIWGGYWCCTLPDISSTACAIEIIFFKNI